MPKIKVLVANRPRLLRELISGMLAEQTDIEAVEIPESNAFSEEMIASIKRFSPNFVITTLEDNGLSKPFISLLTSLPRLRIIAIATHADNCFLFQDHLGTPDSRVQLSEKGILDLLRSRNPRSEKPPLLKAG